MKINSCYIASFGKFKNRKFDFSDGFNLIYGENEAGKSTVMAFIKMMFYGYSGKSTDVAKNPRKKYMPWDSSLMAGSIELTHNGKHYRLSREFGGSNSTDKITLTDLSLGTDIPLDSKGDVGSQYFGIGEAAFEKSVFIGALGAPEKNSGAEGELNGKLSNLVSTGEEDVSFSEVGEKIKKAKESYMSKSGRIGIYDKGIAELSRLEEQLRLAKETEFETQELSEKIKEKELEIAENSAKGNRYFAVMKKAELFKKMDSLKRYVAAEETISACHQKLALPDGSIADKEYENRIREANAACQESKRNADEKSRYVARISDEIGNLKIDDTASVFNALTVKKQNTQKELEHLCNEADALRYALSEQQKATKEKAGAKINIPLLIIGILLALIGGAAAVLTFNYGTTLMTPALYGGAAAATVGIVLFILSFVLKKSSKSALLEAVLETQEQLDKLLSKISKLEDECASAESEINSIIFEQSGKKALLAAKENELIAAESDLLDAKTAVLEKTATLTGLCQPFGTYENAIAIADGIAKLLLDIQAADVALNISADNTNCQTLEEAKSRLSLLLQDETLSGLSADEVAKAKDDFKLTTEHSMRLREELAAMKTRLKSLASSILSVPVLEKQIAELKDKLRGQKAFCDAADIALETLTESFATMRQSFSSVLETETSNIFSQLTEGAYSSVDISKDLDLKVNREDVFGAKEWQFLSAGTTDQAYLALRLALVKLISGDKAALPVIMDDSLTQYDERRSEAALKLLLQYSAEHQTLLFTCHSDILTKAEALGINIIKM